MYSQCDSDHAGDLLVSSDRERESAQLPACRLVMVAAGHCMAKVDVVAQQTENRILATMWRVRRCWLLPVAGAEAGLLHLVINSWGSDGSHVQLCSFVPTKRE